MLWLVLWSFVTALTPVALGLAWKLTSAVGRRIGLGLAQAVASAERSTSLPPLRCEPRPSSLSVTGRTQRLRTKHPWVLERRGSDRS
jgi:hypothetical protein